MCPNFLVPSLCFIPASYAPPTRSLISHFFFFPVKLSLSLVKLCVCLVKLKSSSKWIWNENPDLGIPNLDCYCKVQCHCSICFLKTVLRHSVVGLLQFRLEDESWERERERERERKGGREIMGAAAKYEFCSRNC
jgi:hypothetical protein